MADSVEHTSLHSLQFLNSSYDLTHLFFTQAHLILAASSSHIIASIFSQALSTSSHQSPASPLFRRGKKTTQYRLRDLH